MTQSHSPIIAKQQKIIHITEIKSSTTFKVKHLKGLKRFQSLSDMVKDGFLIYNGERHEFSNGLLALNYKEMGAALG